MQNRARKIPHLVRELKREFRMTQLHACNLDGERLQESNIKTDMPSGDTMEYFTLKIWTETKDNIGNITHSGHASLEMHDGSYIGVFRYHADMNQCHSHGDDVARLGRDSDVTLKLFYKDHLLHPERIKNWLQSYRNGEIIYDPLDTSFSVVYSVLVRSGSPVLDMNPFKLKANDMKEYAYGVLRSPRKQKKFVF